MQHHRVGVDGTGDLALVAEEGDQVVGAGRVVGVKSRPTKSIWVTVRFASAGSIWIADEIAAAARSGSEFTIAAASATTAKTRAASSSFAASHDSEVSSHCEYRAPKSPLVPTTRPRWRRPAPPTDRTR